MEFNPEVFKVCKTHMTFFFPLVLLRTKREKSLLDLTGRELIFFIAAHVVLCFILVTKTVLTTHRRFSYCWRVFAQHYGLFCCSFWPSSCGGGGGRRGWKKEDIPYLVRSFSALTLAGSSPKTDWVWVCLLCFYSIFSSPFTYKTVFV